MCYAIHLVVRPRSVREQVEGLVTCFKGKQSKQITRISLGSAPDRYLPLEERERICRFHRGCFVKKELFNLPYRL